MIDSTPSPSLLIKSEPPSLSELIDRGDRASRHLIQIVEESRQQRQTLLYNVAIIKRCTAGVSRHLGGNVEILKGLPLSGRTSSASEMTGQ